MSVAQLLPSAPKFPPTDKAAPHGLSRDGDPDPPVASLSDRIALWVFIAILACCLSLFVWLAQSFWFVADDWDFLAGRTVGNFHDLFTPHNEHWSTLPILAYRLLWQIVGLRSYLPYLALVVTLYLSVAALLRWVMRRAGVSPWVATVAALVFALFGSGFQNIVYAFQIGFDGSIAFGLIYLLLADHDGRFERRDVYGMVAGLASLMCSGIGVTMVVVVVVAVLIRRGVRFALFHAIPLASIYLAWFFLIGHTAYFRMATGAEIARFVGDNMTATFSAMGHVPGVGIALAILLVVGVGIAWKRSTPSERRRRLAAPLALLIGSVVFLIVTGIGRGAPVIGSTAGPVGRYLDIVAALLLPALAVAADALIRHWRWLTPLVLAALVVGIPGNVRIAVDQTRADTPGFQAYKVLILSLPRLPVARDVPTSMHPDYAAYDDWVTMGWLRAGVSSGRIPPPGPISPNDAAKWTFELAFQPTTHPAKGACVPVSLPATLHLDNGDTVTVSHAITLVYRPPDGAKTALAALDGPQTSSYIAYGHLVVYAEPSGHNQTAVVCHPKPPLAGAA